MLLILLFQSTLPKWAATAYCAETSRHIRYFNPRCPSGQRRFILSTFGINVSISIHAAQVGSDVLNAAKFLYNIISIHAAQVGSDNANKDLFKSMAAISIHAAQVGSDYKLLNADA